MSQLIIGLDPGMTVGLAILDLNGNILTVMSKRGMSKNDIVRFITKFGQPIIVASDVNPLPKTVEKIASVMHAKPHSPEELLHVSEKEKLIKDFSNSKIAKKEHEVDALAAALKAWRNYRPFFLRTKDELKKLDVPEIFEEVISKLIRGDVGNTEDAVIEVLNEKSRFG